MKRKKIPLTLFGVFFLCFAVFYLICLIGVATIVPYPSEESLTYETCTYIKYEYEEKRSTRSKAERYHIYVEEYDKPLEIDNIVFGKANEDVLFNLEPGTEVTVSIFEKNGKLTLYSIAHDEVYILSYDDYVKTHTRNNSVGMVVLSVLFCVSFGFCVAEYAYYRKHGISLVNAC